MAVSLKIKPYPPWLLWLTCSPARVLTYSKASY